MALKFLFADIKKYDFASLLCENVPVENEYTNQLTAEKMVAS